MAKPPSGFWHTRDAAEISISTDSDTTEIAEKDVGYKLDGVFSLHTFSFALGSGETGTLFGATHEASNAFVYVQLCETNAITENDVFNVNPRVEGTFKAFKFVQGGGSTTAGKIYLRSSSNSI